MQQDQAAVKLRQALRQACPALSNRVRVKTSSYKPLTCLLSLSWLSLSLLTLPIALALTALSNRPVQAYSERMYGPVSAGDFKVFKVRMQTNLVIPKEGKRCILLRTWHALPTYRPWCNARSPVGMLEFRCDPTAKMETEKDNLSTHLYWEERQKLNPGQPLSYVSYFKVISPHRTFNPSGGR